jgi:nucleoside-diphosphate-sugar epimerase
MKILITGYTGFIGSYIYDKLLQTKHEVYLLNLREPAEAKIPEIDAVIHCASATPENTPNSVDILRINQALADSLVHAIQAKRVKTLINLSSVAVYGKAITGEIDETPRSVDLDLYGLSKLYIEKFLSAKFLNTDTTLFHLRIPGVTGAKAKNIFLKRVLSSVKSNEEIKISGGDLPFNNILDIDDLTQYIACLLGRPKRSAENHTRNLSSTDPIPLREVIKIFYDVLDKPFNYRITDSYYPHFYINSNKAISEGFNPLNTRDAVIKFIKESEKESE